MQVDYRRPTCFAVCETKKSSLEEIIDGSSNALHGAVSMSLADLPAIQIISIKCLQASWYISGLEVRLFQ